MNGIANEISQPLNGFRAQRRGITRDGRLADLFDARHSPVQRSDQFRELAGEIIWSSHQRLPIGLASRREAFQISPQLPQRQYAFLSGVLAVVEIDADRQAGQAEGIAPPALDDDRPAPPLPMSYDFTRAPKTGAASAPDPHAKALMRARPKRAEGSEKRDSPLYTIDGLCFCLRMLSSLNHPGPGKMYDRIHLPADWCTPS